MRTRKGYKSVAYTTHEEDKELVKSAIEGDTKAYNILIRKYKPILYTAAKRRLPQAQVEDLEDIVMTVLGNTFVKIRMYDPEKSKFFTWMIACLHNYVSGIPRKKKRLEADSYDRPTNVRDAEAFAVADEVDMNAEIDREQISRLVRLLVSQLPEDISKAISMRYFKEASNEEIAEEIGCKPGDVWYKIKKGREMLHKLSKKNKLF
jgi:RNA polymerase sigma-70 factor (ECF subfamily)